MISRLVTGRVRTIELPVEICFIWVSTTLLKMGSYSSTTMSQYWDLILLSSILTILLTRPSNDATVTTHF